MNFKLLVLFFKSFLIIVNCFDDLSEYSSSSITSSSSFSLSSPESYDYEENLKLNLSNNKLANKKYQIECKTDQNCYDSQSICINGNCVRTCSYTSPKADTTNTNNQCVYYHCESKQFILSSKNTFLDNNLIETNNYPTLDRYLNKKKCSWILKNDESFNNSLIQIKFERFSTQFSNDYLYIFAGDSIYSPLIAALSGNEALSDEPSLEADYLNENIEKFNSNEEFEKNLFTYVTFHNTTSLYLLFKTDILSLYTTLSSYKSSFNNDENKPPGISIKYKFSSDCLDQTDNCTNKKPLNFTYSELKLIETVNYEKDEHVPNLRRAFHCSFNYKNYMYIIGGYSFSDKISFISRLNLDNSKWEFDLDRRWSTDVNKQIKSFLPQNRYAHSCVVETNQSLVYMYGGVLYQNEYSSQTSNKRITNEFWSFDLIDNKWTLLNPHDVKNKNGFEKEIKNYLLPVAVSGHSMQMIRKDANLSSVFIFFGYSEYYGSTLNIIQEYNTETKSWNLHTTFNINIGFGHSSVYDKRNNNVYFYGGIISNSDLSKNLYSPFDLSDHFNKHLSSNRYLQTPLISPNLYSFNLYYFEWTKLAKTYESSYLHSSVLFQNKIVFFGGVSISDENPKQTRLYNSNKIKIYDLEENEWIIKFNLSLFNLNSKKNFLKLNKRQRFAHSSIVYNNSLYIFAGFNGFFLNDLFKINLSLIVENLNYNFDKRIKKDLNNQQNFIKTDLNLNKDNFKFQDSRYVSLIESCSRYLTCHSCQLDSNCVWNNKKCEYYTPIDLEGSESNLNQSTQLKQLYKKPSCSQMCSEFDSCLNCTMLSNINGQFQNECVWCASQSKCVLKKALPIMFPFGECFNLINERQECERTITLNSSYSMSLINSDSINTCSILYSNCSSCIQDERCGWCSYDIESSGTQNTGFGTCLEGGQTNSFNSKCKLNWYFSKCPSCECNGHSTCLNSNKFNTCSKCMNNTDGEYCSDCKKGYYGNARNNGVCQKCDCGQQASECDTSSGRCYCNTKGVVGTKCDQCDLKYTGRPNMTDGSCYYNLSIDYQFTFNLNKESDRYYSKINFVNHPLRGNDDDIDFMVRCFRENAIINVTYVSNYNQYEYEHGILPLDPDLPSLSTFNGMQWPFDLLDNLTLLWNQLNENNSFLTTTPSSLINIIQSRSNQNMDKTYNYYFGPMSTQGVLLEQINCTSNEFKYTFSNRDLNYADKNRNFVFIVYVYNFETPLTIQIAFSRKSKIQLLHFFITFFGCLLFLLTIAFVTWKSKQRFDRYRRQRQIVIQMEHMASRPFTRLFIDVTEDKKVLLTSQNLDNSNKMDKNDLKKSPKKPKKGESKKFKNNTLRSNNQENNQDSDKKEDSNSKFKLMPMAVEPLNSGKSAIVTCLLKLPQGGLNCIPKGSSPFTLCSAYVQVSSSSSLLSSTNNQDALNEEEEENNLENENNKQVGA